ncbi:MAG: formate dehydrogenase accessory sulfurtransferase FdhD [Candidatus Omnitrophota bacterium]
MKKETVIKRYRAGQLTEIKGYVAEEKTFAVVINGETRFSVSLSPEDLEAFATGMLVTSGLIASPGDIESIAIQRGPHRKNGNRIDVRLRVEIDTCPLLLASGCGSGGTPERSHPDLFLPAMTEPFIPDGETLPQLYQTFSRRSEVFQETGGVHSAAISDGESILFFAEDIGRHNAVDKVVGKAIRQPVALRAGSYILLTSGRISGEIIRKVSHAGLRAIVSRSAPTCAAIVSARQAGITLIGFLRGTSFNIYI